MRYYNGVLWSDCMGIYKVWACGDVLVDSRDAQSYTTVLKGTQCWMAENLNIGIMLSIMQHNQLDNGIYEKHCLNYNESNCDTYGGLYQWYEMMQYTTEPGTQGICPDGWHLPSDAEWCTLENEVDAGTVSCSSTGWRGIDAGGNLKETLTHHWNPPNTGATNSSGFTALPGGYYDSNTFNSTALSAIWTSSELGSNAWSRWLGCESAQVWRTPNPQKIHGLSVRCVRD